MTDLIVPAGTTLAIDQTYAVAPKYGLFQMGDNARIRLTTDLVLKADRAEFGANCTIDARGQDGAYGAPGINGVSGQPGGNGMSGGSGGVGRSVSIEAALTQVGGLTIDAGGGAGGAGGSGGVGGSSQVHGGSGGNGGAGGSGGDAGQIILAWARAAPGLPVVNGAAPAGHAYASPGGNGGPGGPGGPGGVAVMSDMDAPEGVPGAAGANGKSSTPQVVWRSNLDALLWAQTQDIGPAARFGHRLAFDSRRGRLVLFGGLTSGGDHLGDTWEWDGRFWTQVADTGPAGRAWHAMAFDPASGATLMFGGRNFEPGDKTPAPQNLADTWSWDGQAWIQLADSGPGGRSGAAMAADVKRGRLALFSGGPIGANAAAPISDTWEWDGAAWTQLADTGPAGRLSADMAFDAGAGLLTLFGGLNAQGADFGDTWTWNGGQWTQVADTGPSARDSHAMTPFADAVVLFGGQTLIQDGAGGTTNHGDTWAWEAGAWRQIQDMGPAPRSAHAMATFSDADGEHVTLFGGQAAGPFQDTWRLVERF